MMQQENKLNFSSTRERLIICVILSIYPLIGMAVDLIAPSLPAISAQLHISTAISKNLISIYLLGFAISNFFVGPLSDAIGRRKIIIAGFVGFLIASFLPVIFPNTTLLLSARLLQGLAIGSISVAARALLSDMLIPEKLVRVATLTATMWGIGPIVGPIIGGYLQYYINWQACFCFFALYSFICLVAIAIIVPETHLNRQPLNFIQITQNFKTVMTHRLFMGVIILMGLLYSVLIAFNTLGPFLIQTQLRHSSIYFGHAALGMGLMFLSGTFICRALIKQYDPEKIILYGLSIFSFVAVLGLIAAYIDSKNMAVILIPTFLMFLGVGIIFPACMGKGMSLFRHLAGSAAAMMNLVSILITSLTAFLIGLNNITSAIFMACIYLALMILSGLTYLNFIK